MDSQRLLKTLRAVKPALASRDHIAILCDFVFRDGEVMASDDVLAMSAPCDIGFEGGVNGKLLLDWLSRVSGDVDVTPKKDSVLFKAGRSRLTLPLASTEEFPFEFPKKGNAPSFPFNPNCMQALEMVELSMSYDPPEPWQMGVTVAFEKADLAFCTTDNMTVTSCSVPETIPPKKLHGEVRHLPPRFVKEVLNRANDPLVFFMEDGVLAEWEDGVKLWSSGLTDTRYEQFENTIQHALDRPDPTFVELPEDAKPALKRLEATLAQAAEKDAKVSIKKGVATWTADSPAGKVVESFKLKGHPDVEARLCPNLLVRAIDAGVQEFQIVDGLYAHLRIEDYDKVLWDHLICLAADE